MARMLLFSLAYLLAFSAWGLPSWEENTPYPLEGRANPYNLQPRELTEHIRAGKIHALNYPVEVTGILLPYDSFRRVVDSDDKGLFKKVLKFLQVQFLGAEDFDGVLAWLGLPQYPDEETTGVYGVPYPFGEKPDYRMGLSLMERHGTTGFTFSCAACHSGQIFGKSVIGMPNRFPNANQFFIKGKKGMNVLGPNRYRFFTGATKNEAKMFKEAKKNLRAVGSRSPAVLGMDSAGAHVYRSMLRREQDEFASKSRKYERHPRKDKFKKPYWRQQTSTLVERKIQKPLVFRWVFGFWKSSAHRYYLE